MTQVPKHTFTFLKSLKKNNNREWFEMHKTEFKALETEIKKVAEAITTGLNREDRIEKTKLFRVIAHQDVLGLLVVIGSVAQIA